MNKKWILSGFTDEYAPEFPGQVECAKKYGMDGIELRFVDGINVAELPKEKILECDRQLRDAGVAVCAIGSPLGKFRLDEDLDAHMETSHRVFEYANILGAKNIRMFSFYAPEGMEQNERFDRTVEALGRMLKIAKEHNVILCHENEARLYGDTPAHCLQVMEAFGGEMKSVFDMGNFTLGHMDPYEAYQMLKPYVEYCDAHTGVRSGFVDRKAWRTLEVVFPVELRSLFGDDDFAALYKVLELDPRPQYHDDPERIYGMPYGGYDVRFTVRDGVLIVVEVARL